MTLAAFVGIVGVYWYCYCFQSSIYGEQKPFNSNMNPAVCLSSRGGERDKAAFEVSYWTHSQSTLAMLQTSYCLSAFLLSPPSLHTLSSLSSFFSLCFLSLLNEKFFFLCIALVLPFIYLCSMPFFSFSHYSFNT